MTNQDDMIKLIKSISGQANVLTIPRVYIGFTKSHRAALFLSQCVYWSDRSRLHDGWFYKSFREWHEELGLNQHAVETCVKTLKAGEWLHTKIETVQKSPTTFYRADLDKIATSIRLYLSDHHIEEPYIAETAKYGDEHLEETDKSIKQKTISPSIKQKLSSKTTVMNQDFDSACARLKASYPADYAQAAPVLLEADERPHRLHVRLAALPPDFISHLADALREVNQRRNYRLTYQTSGTNRPTEQGEREQPDAAPDPYAPDDTVTGVLPGRSMMTPEQAWTAALGELQLEMTRATFDTWIKPSVLISVNGSWRIGLPDKYAQEFFVNRLRSTVQRILTGIIGNPVVIECVVMEPRR